MPYGTNVIYQYDGTYDGLMCCVFESFLRKEMPITVETFDQEQSTLFKVKIIETDKERAERVSKSVLNKIGLEAQELIEQCFLTNLPEKEIHIIYFMALGFKYGSKVCEMLDNDHVSAIKKAVLHLSREAHLLLGFIRFSEYDGVLMTQITPKNNVLPIIYSHFMTRFSGETFMIYDKTHKIAFVHKDGQGKFMEAENIIPPKADLEEIYYRKLWKTFYNTVSIEGRYNPKCRQTLMPKRYWGNMTEFQNEEMSMLN